MDKVKAGVKNAVVKGDFDIPILPHVAAEVMKLINDPKIGIPEMEKVVKQDQAIAARVVKMANSTMFRGIQEISSLSQAMSRIGLKNVKDIVVSLGIQSQTFKIAGFEDTLGLVWNHSVACATVAQRIAQDLSADKELAFLSGLMHDIGKPVLVQILSKLENAEKLPAMAEARKSGKKFDDKAFRLPGLRETILPQAFDEFHTVVGGAVAARWNLPETVVQVVKSHHDPMKTEEKYRKLSYVVNLANEICHHMGYGQIQSSRDLDNLPATKALEIEPLEMKELLEEVAPKVEAALSSF